jgi:hypothetical protein
MTAALTREGVLRAYAPPPPTVIDQIGDALNTVGQAADAVDGVTDVVGGVIDSVTGDREPPPPPEPDAPR